MAVRKNIDLFGDERQQRGRGPFAGAQRTARVTQVAKHQRIAEAVVIATAAPDHREVSIGQRVVAHQLTLIGRRIEQRGELGFGQLLSSRHSCLLGP